MTNNITPEQRTLVADRLKVWLDTLPEAQKKLPFFHALGESFTPEQMLKEVEAASEFGDIIVKQELRAIKYYQP